MTAMEAVLVWSQEYAGSSPVALTINNLGVAQSGSASGLGPEGRGFNSLHPDHL